MSIKASTYAVELLERDAELPQGARTVLLCLAARANATTHVTFTGGWLCKAARMTDRNVHRNVHRLVESGYIAVTVRKGLASVVRFPFAAALVAVPDAIGDPPGSRRDSQGQMHPRICGCPECLQVAQL